MLRCPKCGTDNMLTAIFCRGCGERLNLDEIRPDDFANIGTKKQDNTMQNIIGGAIIGAVALIFLIGWMFPAGGMIKTTEDEQSEWKGKAENIEKGASLEMDDKAATAFLNANMGDTPCTVHFLGDGKAKVVFSTKLWGMPVRVSIVHPLEASNRGVAVGAAESYKVGLFPMLESLKQDENVMTPWGNYATAWTKVRKEKKISEATIEKGKITIKR
ncbi:MAG: zinc ribbon domain-containing protein [Victivallales bacterium]|nr:zinc ribbon domain-containing protein [Victivallales bacterium]